MRRIRRWFEALLASAALTALAAPARADDVADEADLQFQLGTEAYSHGDFRQALEHFLTSNRLAPNRNVVFNIARTFEKLGRYPEAYRYYAQALEGETDAASRARISAALEQIQSHVAVLDIVTDPPGATIYVDRKDLGARGESPRALGLAAGRYKIIAELSGYHPAETTVEQAHVGTRVPVRLRLEPIVGKLSIEGEPRGALVRVDDTKSPPRCGLPCELNLSPGRHALYLEYPGYRPTELPVEVTAAATVTARARLDRLTGTLVIGTDEPGALVEVDDQPVGFTPSIVPLPVGEHRLRLSLTGFRAVERRIVIEQERRTRIDVALTQAEEVTAASRITQAVEDAPSSVTIIPRQELRAFGYPTIAEAIRGVRGVYLWDDRSYVSAGMRGLGRLGGYGNRLLVLNDGQPTNDDWIGSSYIGYDARTDLGDVERIEVVRGPGSVLYGTNAFSGVINVVTRRRDVDKGGEAAISTADYGVARGRVRADARIGDDGGIWTSVAAAHSAGRDFFFPEYVASTPPEVAGNARGVDGFDAGTVQGQAWWRFLHAQWFAHSHTKHLPTAEYETTFGDPRTRQTDSRAYLEVRAEPKLGKELELMTRVHINHYRFLGIYPRAASDGGVETDTFRGSWVGVEQRAAVMPIDGLRLTFGGEYQNHFQVVQTAGDDAGAYIKPAYERPYANDPLQIGAGYFMADADVAPNARFSGGARYDWYSTFGGSLNPRVAVIVKPYPGGNTKLLAGKAFRAPSTYELYYNDGGFTEAASVDQPKGVSKPESIYSVEVEHSHRFTPTVVGTVATYANYITDLIAQTNTDPFYYENIATPLLTLGAEAAIRRDWRQGFMVQGSYGYQHSRFLQSTDAGDLFSLRAAPDKRNVANSPEHLLSLKGAAPIITRAVTLASRLTFEGPRWDRFENTTDLPQEQSQPFVLWDLMLTGEERRFGLSWSLGVYNLFDWQYSLPVSGEFEAQSLGVVMRRIPQNGRTLAASLELML